MTAYMELSEDPSTAATIRIPSYALKTTEGGVTWILGPMISATTVASGKKFEWDTHPSVARIDANTLIASFRSGNQTDKTWTRTGWFDLTRSTDNGKTWAHLIRLGESPGNNSCPTSTQVVTLPNGRKRVVTLMWLRPPDKQSCEKSKLLARFSDDKGDTWSDTITLRDDAFGWDTGYPIATVRADGKVVVCYWLKTVNQDEPNYIGATVWDAASAVATPAATPAAAASLAKESLSTGRLVGHWGEQVADTAPGVEVPDLLDPALGNTDKDDGVFVDRKPTAGEAAAPAQSPPRWTTDAWVGRTALEFRGKSYVAVTSAASPAGSSLGNLGEALTVAAWVRLDPTPEPTGWNQIANIFSTWYLERHGDPGMTSTKHPGFWVQLPGFEGEKGFRNVRGKTSLNDGYWHHAAAQGKNALNSTSMKKRIT